MPGLLGSDLYSRILSTTRQSEQDTVGYTWSPSFLGDWNRKISSSGVQGQTRQHSMTLPQKKNKPSTNKVKWNF